MMEINWETLENRRGLKFTPVVSLNILNKIEFFLNKISKIMEFFFK